LNLRRSPRAIRAPEGTASPKKVEQREEQKRAEEAQQRLSERSTHKQNAAMEAKMKGNARSK
jgi:hypothetical protein